MKRKIIKNEFMDTILNSKVNGPKCDGTILTDKHLDSRCRPCFQCEGILEAENNLVLFDLFQKIQQPRANAVKRIKLRVILKNYTLSVTDNSTLKVQTIVGAAGKDR